MVQHGRSAAPKGGMLLSGWRRVSHSPKPPLRRKERHEKSNRLVCRSPPSPRTGYRSLATAQATPLAASKRSPAKTPQHEMTSRAGCTTSAGAGDAQERCRLLLHVQSRNLCNSGGCASRRRDASRPFSHRTGLCQTLALRESRGYLTGVKPCPAPCPSCTFVSTRGYRDLPFHGQSAAATRGPRSGSTTLRLMRPSELASSRLLSQAESESCFTMIMP